MPSEPQPLRPLSTEQQQATQSTLAAITYLHSEVSSSGTPWVVGCDCIMCCDARHTFRSRLVRAQL
jgi:hypothetical protein